MGWAAGIAAAGLAVSAASAGYSAYEQDQAGDAAEDAYGDQRDQFAYMNSPERMREMMSLFEGPNMARDILEAIGTGDIEDYLTNPLKLTQLEKRERQLFEESEPLFREIQQLLTGPIRDPLLQLLDHGFKTDIDPIIAAENRRFFNETIPGVAERYAGSLDSSGFENALAQSAEDMGIYLGEREYDANEAAAGRRMQGLQMAPNLFTAPLDLQHGFATAMGAAGQRNRERRESVRPGFRQLQAFPSLAGVEQGQGFFLPGYQPGAGAQGYGNLSGGANIGGLLNSLAQFGKLFQTGQSTQNSQLDLTMPTTTMPTSSFNLGTGYDAPATGPSDYSFFA
jgi:hypothetical protein